MTGFERCPNCGKTGSGEATIFSLYECENCDELFCSNCSEDGRCPHCGSDDFKKIGALI